MTRPETGRIRDKAIVHFRVTPGLFGAHLTVPMVLTTHSRQARFNEGNERVHLTLLPCRVEIS